MYFNNTIVLCASGPAKTCCPQSRRFGCVCTHFHGHAAQRVRKTEAMFRKISVNSEAIVQKNVLVNSINTYEKLIEYVVAPQCFMWA